MPGANPGRTSYRRTIEACANGATTSTEPLRGHVLQLASPVEALSNVVSEEMIRLAERVRQAEAGRPSRAGDDEVVIAYLSGSLTHRGDFEEAAEAVLGTLESYPHARFHIVGRLELDQRFDRFAPNSPRSRGTRGRPFAELQAQARCEPRTARTESVQRVQELREVPRSALVGVPTVASLAATSPA